MAIKTAVAVALLLTLEAIFLHRIEFDPLTPALGNNTVTVNESRVAGHHARDDRRPLAEALADVPTRDGGRFPIVWIGNSHQHAINDLRPGDELSSVVLHRLLNGNVWPGERPVYGMSYANMTYEEQFLLTLALASLPEQRRPRLIIHGVRFHDAREMGVRKDLRPILLMSQTQATIRENGFIAEHPALEQRLQSEAAAAIAEKRKDEGAEAWLVDKIGNHVPIFERRELLYYTLYEGLFRFRNWVFRINTQSKRSILPARYAQSLDFLELALLTAREAGIQVLLYNVPLRQEVDTPYVAEQYQQFRKDLAVIAQRQQALYADYDDLIPKQHWGSWYATDYPDFSHFTGEGHRLLAASVKRSIEPLLEAAPPKGTTQHALQ